MSKKIVYIAGPISGVSQYWEPFEKAEDDLIAAGFIPLTPTYLPSNISNEKAMQICMAMINVADAVLFLPGSNKSEGATIELAYCDYIGKPYEGSIKALKEVLA